MSRLAVSRVAGFAILSAAACGPDAGATRPAAEAAGPTAVAAPLVAGPADFDSGIYVPFNDVPLAVDGVTLGVVNGNAAVSFVAPAVDGAVDESGEVTTFSSTINLRAAVTLEVRADAAGEFSTSIPLPVTPLPAFAVGANILVTPFAYTTLNVSGSAEAGSRVSVVAPFEAGVRFELPGDPTITLTTPPAFEPELGPPDLAGGAEVSVDLEVGVVFLVAIQGVPIGGPSLSASMGVGLHVVGSPAPAWGADLTTELRGGWSFANPVTSLPDLPEASVHIAGDEWALPGGPLPVGLPSTRWSRVYDLGESELSGAVVRDGDGAVLVGNSALGNRPWVAAIDGAGVPAWQNSAVLQPFGAMNAKSLVRTSDGDLLAAGWTGTSNGMRVERYEADGTPLWARTMAGPQGTLIKWNASAPTASGGAVLAGHVTYVSAAITRCMFAEIDASGALLWSTEVDLGAGPTGPTINAVALTPAGEIIGAGQVNYQDTPSPYDAALDSVNGLVVRLSAQGAALGAFAVGGTLWDEVNQLAVFPDGSYALGGYSSPARKSEQNWAWLTTFEADDALRWSATYAGATNGSYGHVGGLATLPSGGLLVTGGYGTPTATQEAWLFRVDRAGMPVWFKALRGPKDDTLAGVLPMDGGVLAFGYTKSVNDVAPSTQRDLWVVRTSVDGMVDFTPESGMDASNDAARWKRTTPAVRPLAPTNLPGALTSAAAPFAVAPAAAAVELLTR